MSEGLREEQGRLFEIAFNTGILAYLQQHQIGQPWIDFYQPDLACLQFPQLLTQLLKHSSIISQVNKKIVESWSKLILLKGFLGGLNFVREYCQSQFGKSLRGVEVLYYQCSFVNENSLNTHSIGDYTLDSNILAQFADIVKNLDKNELQNQIKKYQEKGEFLKADTLPAFLTKRAIANLRSLIR